MTPAELRERRRDRELRKEWLRHKRELEIERLTRVAEGIRNLKSEYPSLSQIFDLAIAAANLAIDGLKKHD